MRILFSIIVFFVLTVNLYCTVIDQIKIQGNERIEDITILSHLNVELGKFYSKDELNAAHKELLSTGFFQDVKLVQEKNILIVEIVENPIINRVIFEGNKQVDDNLLENEIQLKPRKTYTKTIHKQDIQRIKDIYLNKGYFSAVIKSSVIKRRQNRLDVIFEITEGKVTPIRSIIFSGNKAFSESSLKSVIRTKETRWYRFFSSDDIYSPDRLEVDKELLRQFYLKNGYIDFKVNSAVPEITADLKEFFITFSVYEGKRYKLGQIKVESNISGINIDDLIPLITVKEGNWYNIQEIEDNIAILRDELGNKGFAFVDIVPKAGDIKNEVIPIIFRIVEASKIYINKIHIIGNERTDDDIIRRELQIYEGDAYNTSKIKASERNILNLGFFKRLNIQPEATDIPDKVDLIVDLEEESSTGEFMLAGGYSTLEGPIAEVGMAERNLFGRAQDLKANFRVAKRSQDFDVSFMEPYFLDRKLLAGINLFNTKSNDLPGMPLNERAYGLGLTLGYDLAPDLSQVLRYTIQKSKISGIKENASRFVKEQQGTFVTSSISQSLFYDKLDNRINPTSGYSLGLSNTLAGVGGDVRYLGNIGSAKYFYPFTKEWVLGLLGSVGYMFELGKKTRVVDRYSLGGYSLRGFDFNGIGPRAKDSSKDNLRGLAFYRGTAELVFPLGLPKKLGVKGSMFVDVGSLWHCKEPKSEVNDKASLRAGAGFGISWITPMGPLRLDFAWPVAKEKNDKTRVFLFGFTTRF